MKNNLNIREAKETDIEELVKINRELCDYYEEVDRYNYSGKRIERFFRKFFLGNYKKRSFKYLIAENAGEIIGYISAQIRKAEPHIRPKKIGEIFSLYVSKEYRREGVGKELFKEMMGWFKRNKIKHIELFVHVRNKMGVKFWRKFGFYRYLEKMRSDL